MSKPLSQTNDVPAIAVKDLSVQQGTVTLLSSVTFEIAVGEIAAVIGPNGSGKTTLLRAMLGLISVRGQILFHGEPLTHVRKQIGYLPQRFSFDRDFPITVHEFLRLTSNGKIPSAHMHEKLEEVGLSKTILEKRLGLLSGGQLQRVLIAQATLHRPTILILDEPSTGIDIAGEQQFYDLIQQQRAHYGTTILFVSHDIAVISHVVDQVICINKKLICFGPPKTALTEEKLSELYFHHRHSHH